MTEQDREFDSKTEVVHRQRLDEATLEVIHERCAYRVNQLQLLEELAKEIYHKPYTELDAQEVNGLEYEAAGRRELVEAIDHVVYQTPLFKGLPDHLNPCSFRPYTDDDTHRPLTIEEVEAAGYKVTISR